VDEGDRSVAGVGTRGTLTGTCVAVAVTAVVGAMPVEPDGRWYRQLRKPDWQPPPWVFGPVWTALYADLALSSAVALSVLPGHSSYARALAGNLALNAGWSWVFWRVRRPWWAAVEAAVLTVSSADLLARTVRVHPRAGAALVPYVAWCAFATMLSTAVARRNP
jgi:benzodiazapine receptor